MGSGKIERLAVIGLYVALAAAACSAQDVVYVDGAAAGANNGSSWADAYAALQDALTATAQMDAPVEIRIAQGIYTPDRGADLTPGDRDAVFQLRNGLTLKGGYAGATAEAIADEGGRTASPTVTFAPHLAD